MLWVLAGSLDGPCIGVLSAEIAENASGTALTVYDAEPLALSSYVGGFSLRFRNATSGALGDLDTLVDTGKIMVRVAFVTAS